MNKGTVLKKETRRSPKIPDFRIFLQEELLKRCRSNPKYSLRAFAQFLGVESSRFSKMLRGERPINAKFIEHFGKKLSLPISNIEKFKNYQIGKKYGPALSKLSAKQDYHQLAFDSFEIISDWHHYAILELIKVRGFKPTSEWVGRRLGIAPHLIDIYLERLKRVGLLKVDEKGHFIDQSNGFSTHVISENYTSYAHQRSQEQVLNLAIQAMATTPIEKCDQSTMMMATHTDKIQEAKLKIKQFRRELCAFLEDTTEKNAVFQLSVSLFPLAESENL